MILDPDALAAAASPPIPAETVLPRRLGVAGLVLIIVAFNAPLAVMAGFAQLSVAFGSGIGAPVSFLVAGGILLVFAAGFVGMSRFIENPGAFYQFIVAGAGRTQGLAGAFLATAAYLLMSAGSYPYLGLIAVDCMTHLFGRPIFPWSVWALIFLAVITGIGLLRIDTSMKVLGKLVCLEVALVAIWQVAVLIRGGPEGYSPASFTPAAFLHGSPGLGVLFAMLCMIGIEAGACFSAETINPEVAVGRATYAAIAFMTLFYGLGVWLYIVTQGASKVVASATGNPVGSFFSSIDAYLGPVFVNITSLTLVTSQMIASNSVQGSASRYLFSLGRINVLPASLARVHPRLESPYIAVAAVAGLSLVALVAVIVLRINPVTSYAAMTGMGIYFLLPLLMATSGSILVFYRRNRQLQASSWTRLYAPALSAILIGVLFVLTSLNLKVLVGDQTVAWASMGAVAAVPVAGWIVAVACRRRRPLVYEAIGRL